jgi:hypothetical protein
MLVSSDGEGEPAEGGLSYRVLPAARLPVDEAELFGSVLASTDHRLDLGSVFLIDSMVSVAKICGAWP